MTQVAQVLQTVEINKLPEEVLSNPDTTIKVKFLSLNMQTRDCVIQLDYKAPSGRKFNTAITSARLTVTAIKWFTNQRPVLDEEGKWTGVSLTNFQRYLQKRDIPIDTLLGDMVFECKNHSEEYALNPFSLRFNKTYDVCTVELVNMPSKKPIVRTNPMLNTSEVIKYVYPMRSDGNGIMRLSKQSYKRVIIR